MLPKVSVYSTRTILILVSLYSTRVGIRKRVSKVCSRYIKKVEYKESRPCARYRLDSIANYTKYNYIDILI